jgi:hypothetical protein|tara:strand:- start:1076 stop:1387 length:312 start_codon:yes stop_codon:yes gene_type:complete
MTLIAKLLESNSPYISNLVYDVDVRLLFIECLEDPSDEKPSSRLVFPEITSYSEINQGDAFDDELMDDLVTMDWSGENRITIVTCKKEITIELTGTPFSEEIG